MEKSSNLVETYMKGIDPLKVMYVSNLKFDNEGRKILVDFYLTYKDIYKDRDRERERDK